MEVRFLGSVDYDEASRLQEARVRARQNGEVADALFLLEHSAVITLGRGADEGHVLRTDGIPLRRTGRGGDVTIHGPGQLVGYPVLELARRDLHRYLRDLEEVLIRTLGDFGISGKRILGRTGVWVGEAKIAAIGVRVSRWVTSHGFALNVDPDLALFSWIVPCGIRDGSVTSMAAVLGRAPQIREVARCVVEHFRGVLEPRLAGQLVQERR